MTDTERGFLADICANPDDDTPRLIYADWLADHDQEERAKFIRVQIELARLEAEGAGEFRSPVLDQRYVALLRRERELLDASPHGRTPHKIGDAFYYLVPESEYNRLTSAELTQKGG